MQYTQDYDETMPLNNNSLTNGIWMHTIQPYVKSYQLYKCPSDSVIAGDPALGNNYTSYGINMVGYSEGSGNANGPSISQVGKPVAIASIDSVATTLFAMDANNYQVQAPYADIGTANGISLNAAVTPRALGQGLTPISASILERHLETANILWCDGHVMVMKLDALLKPGVAPNAGKATYFTRGSDPE